MRFVSVKVLRVTVYTCREYEMINTLLTSGVEMILHDVTDIYM